MKTNSIIALILSISLFGLFGCADKYEVDYEAPVKIEFAGVDQNNRISLTKGIAEYTATVKVQGEIMSFEIYQADSKTGMQGSLIEETAQSFADGINLPDLLHSHIHSCFRLYVIQLTITGYYFPHIVNRGLIKHRFYSFFRSRSHIQEIECYLF